MPLELAPTTLHHLPRAPLVLALVQVRYAPVLNIERGEEVARFQEALGRGYELVARQATPVVRVFVGAEEVEHPQPPTSETLWRFERGEGGWVISLSPSTLGFEASNYSQFDSFAEEYKRVLNALAELFEPPSQRRLGVRYINEIHDERVTGERIHELITPELVAPLAGEMGKDVVSSLSEWRFRRPDGDLVMRHGIVDAETYLLDFDYFSEDVVRFDPAAINETVVRYHDVIESLFVASITDNYLAELTMPQGSADDN